MARKSECEQCEKYNPERGLCRKSWNVPVFDDTECKLLKGGDTQLNVEKQWSSQNRFQGDTMENKIDAITISDRGFRHVKEIAKWTRFLVIVGTIEMALFAIGSLFMLTEGGSTAYLGIIYIIIIAACCYPIKKAYDFATHMKNSALNTDNEELEKGLDDLRSILKYIGVWTIIAMILYAILLIVIFAGVGILGVAAIFN